ncbi:NAD(+) diphosphatase [Corynebacterium lubricantis]|uniref:NAD(+) diphosphatase n=1 Tax=Corynebacterium lubricantis TaxID=541095 RepID=UPI00035E5A7A|nr:NUDIX domain-containing protein [Corynebacterium lubricantis]
MAKLLLLDETGAFPLDMDRQPLYITAVQGSGLGHAIRVQDDIFAVRVPRAVVKDVALNGIGYARNFAEDRTIARAVALLANRERALFDPRDGSPVDFDEAGFVSQGAREFPIFPRLDPAVIGVVVHEHRDSILLGENRHRPGFYSCIAGYVEHGESLEEAFIREVFEETGYHAQHPTYFGSQPWAMSGSLMMGFYASLSDEEPSGETDGELGDILWATRDDLNSLTLPMPGSLARTLIENWRAGNYEIRSEGNV